MKFGGYLLRKSELSTSVKKFYKKFFDHVSISIPLVELKCHVSQKSICIGKNGLKSIFLRMFFVLQICITTLSADSIAKDELFMEFMSKLSTDWKVKFEKEEMVFERIEPIYVLPTNLEEKKVEIIDEEKKLEKFKKYGMRLKPLLRYKFAKRRKIKEELTAISKKEEIEDSIYKLRIKYKIDQMVNLKKTTPENEVYEPKSKKQKLNLKKFLKEKEILEKKIPLFPDYIFRNYFITLIEKKGMKTLYKDIYPESVVGEFLEIEKNLYKYKTFRQDE